jgi:hypothetical protein
MPRPTLGSPGLLEWSGEPFDPAESEGTSLSMLFESLGLLTAGEPAPLEMAKYSRKAAPLESRLAALARLECRVDAV